jgi:hypothetical protein
MPSTTDIAVYENAQSHLSSPEPQRVVWFGSSDHLLGGEYALTEQSHAAGVTMFSKRVPVRMPRVVRSTDDSKERFTLLQKWDGVVLEADEETFTARLFDGLGELPPQQATFSREELSSEEQSQIAEGAPFVWTIGYRHIGTTRRRDSTIYFRRLPSWSADEITAARTRVGTAPSALARE